jgi:hypothetical protein
VTKFGITVQPGKTGKQLSAVVLGRPVHIHHSDQRRGIPYPAASPGKADGDPPGQTGVIPGG